MHELKLSIIVPIYNVEQFLRKCVESLLAQDLDPAEYEIILVDDGSSDNCPAICDEYAKLSETNQQSSIAETASNYQPVMPRIKVIHQPNGGLSAARNSGLKVAEGKYVQFVDSDDYLQPNVLRGLVEQMEHEDLDVLRFKWQNVRVVKESGGEKYEVFNPNKSDPYRWDDYSPIVTTGEEFLNTRFGYACYAVQFIVRRSLLVGEKSEISGQKSDVSGPQSPILFTPGIHFEDTDWTPRMLLAAQRVASTDTMVYNYYIRQGSITKTVDMSRKIKNINDHISIIAALYEEYSQKTDHRLWHNRMITRMALATLANVLDYQYNQRQAYFYQLKQLSIFPLSVRGLSSRDGLWALLANCSLSLYTLCYRLRRAL